MTFWGVDVFAAGLLFARVGAMVMLLPAIGEAPIPARIRLAFALTLSLVLVPVVGAKLPQAPAELGVAAGLIFFEITIGLMIGATARILMAALAVAGQVVGLETSLAFAQTTDPTQGQAGQIFGIFLNLFGVAMIFATNLHHAFLAGIVGSYEVFAPGRIPPIGDAAELAVRTTGDAMRIGLQMAAPVMLAGLVFRLGLGVLSRLIPQIQVFFVAMPLNVLGGMAVFALGLSMGMLVFLDRLDQFAGSLQ